MNKNSYRIVFNKNRGQMMVVAEIASAQGKAASGERGDSSACSLFGPRLKQLSVAVLIATSAQAQVIADRAAPAGQRPTVLTAGSANTPLVNIQTPSAAGVSRNTYSQFDVRGNGVILNNSRTNVQTQLGGFVQGNPWLATGSARVILNEVNSSAPSQLNGYIEVGGQRAEVIVANPAGVAIDGAGFINASRVTITTGSTVVNGGSLEGYLVQRGDITVGSKGLDTSTAGYTAILARAVQVNGGIWAKELNVTTGANQISAPQGSAAAVTGSAVSQGTQPLFALDVSALGGMYAGKILLIGTESGVGVRNAGTIGASAGQVQVSVDGMLTNSGSIQAASGPASPASTADVRINTTGAIQNSGTVYAAGNTSVQAAGNITNSKLIAAFGHTSVQATGASSEIVNNPNAAIAAGMSADGKINQAASLNVAATQSVNNSQALMAAGANITLSAASLNNSRATLTSLQGSLTVDTAGVTDNDSGTIQAATSLTLTNAGLSNTLLAGQSASGSITAQNIAINTQAQSLNNHLGTIVATQTLGVQSGALNNDAGLIQAGRALSINTNGQTLNNTQAAGYAVLQPASTGGIASGGAMVLTTGALNNAQGYLGAVGAISGVAGQTNNTAGGRIIGQSSLTLNLAGLNNQGGQVQALGDITLHAGADSLDNRTGLIRSSAVLSLNAASIYNGNTLGSAQGLEAQNIAISTTVLNNNQGAVRADRDAAVNSTGSIYNSQGLLSAGNNLTVQDSSAARSLAVVNTDGTLIAGQNNGLQAASLTGDGKVLSKNDLSINLTNDYQHGVNAQITANGNASLTTTGQLTNSGVIQAGVALLVNAQNIDNTATGQINAGTTSLTAAHTLTNRGVIDGVDTQLNATTVNNIGTGRIYGNAISIAAATLKNGQETLNGITQAAAIAAREKLDIGVQTIDNTEHALIFSAGDIYIGSALDANRLAAGKAGTITNASATIEALGDITINAARVNNLNNRFSTQLVPVANSSYNRWVSARPIANPDRLNNLSGILWQAADVNIFGDGEVTYMYSQDGQTDHFYRYDINRTVQETVITNSAPGQILAGGNIKVNADNIVNHNSRIIAGGALNTSGLTIDNPATLGERITTDTGIVNEYYRIERRRNDVQGLSQTNYAPPAIQEGIVLNDARQQEFSRPTGTGTTVAASAAVNTNAQVSGAGTVTATNGLSVRTITPFAQLPSSSLFVTNPAASASYLVETDPRFANYRQWLGSDYLLAQLQLDPTVTQKRLGDGFYEQRLVREQIAQLTAQRFLADYRSDEEQYKALMNNGITYAKAHTLRPGIALTPAQIAQLTSDIVWLVEQTVTLPGGTQQKVLVPRVYVRVQPGDISGTGALLAGKQVSINVSGDLNNSGTIAGRDVVRLSAENLNHIAGRINAEAVNINTHTDLNIVGGSITADSQLLAQAGRDLNVTTTTRSAQSTSGANSFNRTSIERVAGLYVTGSGSNNVLVASAGRDVNVVAGVISHASAGGSTFIEAGRDLNLFSVQTTSSDKLVFDAQNTTSRANSRQTGTTIEAAGSVQLKAGQDITVRASSVQASGALTALASNNINVLAGQDSDAFDANHQHASKKLLSKSSVATRDTRQSSTAVASSLGGATVVLRADKDITIKGSSVISDQGTTLLADRDILITAAQNTSQQDSARAEKKSGLMGAGTGFSIGKREQSNQNDQQNTTQAGSTLGAIDGSVTVIAGNNATVQASSITTPAGDITLLGKNVQITDLQNTNAEQTETKSKQSGLTVALSSPVVSAVQAVEGAVDTQTQAKGSRMQALAAVNTGFAAKGAVDAIQAAGTPNAVGLTIAVSAGTSKSQSNTASSANTAKSSTVKAGGNITITASGADAKLGDPTQQRSDITIQGSQIQASKTTTLDAQDNLNLLASQNTTQQTSSSSNSSSSVGVTFGIGAGTTGVGFNIAASRGKGQGAGNEVTYNNTLIEGNQVNLRSGKDTTLIGAVVKGTSVNANIAGNLKIESLQDTSVYHETSSNTGGSLSISAAGIPTGGSVTAGKTKIDSNLQSVGQQSAIRAGDGGFNVNVAGNTQLIGGQITSTQKAVDDQVNSFQTKGQLTVTNLANTANYNATGSSITVGVGTELASSGAGAGKATGNAASTSEGAITGVAGNKQARTGDKEAGLQPIFNLEAVKLDVATQIEITKKFGQNASKAVGDYAGEQLKKAKTKNEEAAQADQAGNPALASQLRAEAAALDATWGEGQPGRVALHTLVGALGGGVGGAVGAASSQTLVPLLAAEVNKLDIPKELKEGLILAAGAAVGSATGGVAGLAAGVNATGQNFLSHTQAKELQKDMAACKAKPKGCADQDERSIRDKYIGLSNDNISKVEKMIIAGDVAGVANLEGQAANSSEVIGALSTRQDEQIFTERQNNIKIYGSIKGAYSLFGTDVQQAQDVANFRRDNCQTISPAACTTLTLEAMDDRMKRVGILMAVGSLTPLAVNGARRLTAPGKTAQSNLTAAQLAEAEKFITKGVPFTDDMLVTNPAVKSMFEDFKRALGNNSLAERLTRQAVESGSETPTQKQVGPNDSFVKLVPFGSEPGKSSFYVSKSQYDLFVGKGMDAAQISEALGLPAQSFAAGGASGFQAYVMQPKPGQLATVYQSTVAPVQQGSYTGQGGATQYIVPELGKFTDPKPIGAIISAVPFTKPITPSLNTVIAPVILPNSQKKKVTP